MKLSKLILAVVGTAVLLGALVTSASARSLSNSSQTNRAAWTRMDFEGGFGTIECEVSLEGSYHTRTIAKVVGSLIGYITGATVIRCARGGATINRGSLPWHRRYAGFVGTLPNITAISETVTGAEWTVREPVFGITCTVRRESSSTTGTYTVGAGRAITRADVSGTSPCGSFTGRLRGSTTNVENQTGTGTRITVTLI
jgi:predicted hotdog family 3-hydroxylacyl-ACP dehydratase